MSDHAVLIEFDEPLFPPIKPTKGAWGVGKEYRKHRRHYAKAMREYKRGKQTVHHKVYIPHATFRRVGEAFEVLGKAANEASEVITQSFERFYANDPVLVAEQKLRKELYAGKVYGFDVGNAEDVVIEGTIVDGAILGATTGRSTWGPDDCTYDEPIRTGTSFSTEFTLDTTAHETIRKLFGIL